jgi:hypothetical protein
VSGSHLPGDGPVAKVSTVVCIRPVSSRWAMTSMALSPAGGTSTWTLVAMR